jgi:hypothetical protein
LPVAGTTDHPLFGLSTHKICTQTNKFVLDDGFKVGSPGTKWQSVADRAEFP